MREKALSTASRTFAGDVEGSFFPKLDAMSVKVLANA